MVTTFCLAGAPPRPRLDNDHLGGERMDTEKYRYRGWEPPPPPPTARQVGNDQIGGEL